MKMKRVDHMEVAKRAMDKIQKGAFLTVKSKDAVNLCVDHHGSRAQQTLCHGAQSVLLESGHRRKSASLY